MPCGHFWGRTSENSSSPKVSECGVVGPRADAGERHSEPSPRSPRRSAGCSFRTAAKATRTASTSPLSPPKSSGRGAQGPPRSSAPKQTERRLARVPCRRVAQGRTPDGVLIEGGTVRRRVSAMSLSPHGGWLNTVGASENTLQANFAERSFHALG
jgi:hypothetical protein